LVSWFFFLYLLFLIHFQLDETQNMKNIKPASTIMLARDFNGQLEVLLLKRNKALAFAAGLWVFPGGKIEADEIEKSENDLEAAKIAAVRETKEEANLDVQHKELIFFSHWTTPVIEPRRYSTWFFFGEIKEASSEVTIDDSEIKEYVWLHPQVALDKLKEGELAMMPPTIISLQLIRKCLSVAEAKEKIRDEEPIFILPVLQPKDGKMFCLYEGDAGYESADIEKVGARHRMILDMKKGKFNFEFKDCKNVKPVNGGMHL
jgi:8-oxo-dGTP pyrophosphatase MutT (NUDIX family)